MKSCCMFVMVLCALKYIHVLPPGAREGLEGRQDGVVRRQDGDPAAQLCGCIR